MITHTTNQIAAPEILDALFQGTLHKKNHYFPVFLLTIETQQFATALIRGFP
jgi:hypothetical protein